MFFVFFVFSDISFNDSWFWTLTDEGPLLMECPALTNEVLSFSGKLNMAEKKCNIARQHRKNL